MSAALRSRAERRPNTEHRLTHDEGGNHMADTYTVERKIHVDAPASAVYERIVELYFERLGREQHHR